MRVMFDRRLRTPPTARLLSTLDSRACHDRDDGRGCGRARTRASRSRRAAPRSSSTDDGHRRGARRARRARRRRRCCSKAAPALHAAAWDEGLVDYVRLYVTPHVARTGTACRFSTAVAFSSAELRRAARRSRSGRRADGRICSRASLKRSARSSSASRRSGGLRLRIATALAPELRPGDSVAVNGVCLTVIVADQAGEIHADVGPETLRVTTLGGLARARRVNLERPLRADGRFGGHFVQGHVDAVGRVEDSGRSRVPLADGEFPAGRWRTSSCTRARSRSTASA